MPHRHLTACIPYLKLEKGRLFIFTSRPRRSGLAGVLDRILIHFNVL